jgi:uncharacterized RDD family membrane protein YckC
MKCPKCGYLGFESGDRCRNCGYDFSLSASVPASIHPGAAGKLPEIDFALDPGPDEGRPPLDLERIIGAPEVDAAGDLPLFSPAQPDRGQRPAAVRRTGAVGAAAEDMPLITGPLRPRAPLGVRRATGEVPRARPRTAKPAAPQEETLFETPPVAVIGQTWESKATSTGGESPASPWRRAAAGLIDLTLLCTVDAIVVYLTLRLLGLTTSEMSSLPLLPLAGFFLLLNGGYFVAFTAVGGQSIGKMALGIKVIGQEENSVPVGRATVRTLAYIVSALPLGAGFLPGVISADRLALHDRLAHTRVVRPSQT